MKIELLEGEEFWLIEDTARVRLYFSDGDPAPVPPMVPTAQVYLCESTEDQSVILDGDFRIQDSEGNSFALIVGGRPKCRRK